jgi:hypothetical protein
MLAALLAQAVSLVLLRHRIGRRWLLRPVVLFMLASTVALGIAPALLAIPSVSAWDTFANGVKHGFTDQADLIMSVVMLAFTIAYLLTHPERAEVPTSRRPADLAALTRVLNFPVLAAACVPMTVVTAAGRGFNDGGGIGAGTPLETSLVSTFFIIIIPVAAVALVLRHGTRWFLPALIVQSLLLALAGERTPILADGLALIIVLIFAGIRLPRRQLLATAALAVVAILAINGVRAEQGRGIFYTNSGLESRISALGSGLLGGGPPAGGAAGPGLVAQFATREAGVDFAGAILQSMSWGQPRLSAGYVPESLLLAVPSFLWNSKLATGLGMEPAQLQIDDFGLQQINYIPGMVGTYIGMLSLPWLLLLFFFLGLVFGRFERWLLRECTPARVILLIGAITTALLYDAGLPAMLVQMRAAAALALVAKCAELLPYGPRARRAAIAGLARGGAAQQ